MPHYPSSTATLADDGLPVGGLIRLPQVLAAIPVSRSTWLEWVSQGRAPAPIKIGARAVAWRVHEVRAFLATLDVGAPDQNALKAAAARKRKAEKAGALL